MHTEKRYGNPLTAPLTTPVLAVNVQEWSKLTSLLKESKIRLNED